MSDITFEVGPVAGDDVTFDVGPVSGDDVSFDIPVPGTVDLTGVAMLAEANEFTAAQSIDVPVPVTPLADIGTTKPTILVHLHGQGGAVDHFALTLDIGGGVIFKTAGTLSAVIGTDGEPTDEWVAMSIGPTGPAILSVTSSDPGELPFIGDILTSTPKPLVVGTPTDNAHAATKAYVDAGGGGGVALGETSTTAYRGDRGKTAYDHSQVTTGNPHGTTAADVGAVAASLVDAAGDLLVGTANDTAGRLAVGTKNKVLTSDGTTPQWSLASLWRLAPSKAAIGDWQTQMRGPSAAGTQSLNRTVYVPWPIPGDWTGVDGIAAMPTTATASALCRLGLYLPHPTTGKPDVLVVDAGQADFSSAGGASAVARERTFTSVPVTPDSLIYVSVTPQGATAPALMATLEVLRMFGYASSTVATAFANPAVSTYYTDGVTGALASTPSITTGTNVVGQPVVALRRSA